MSASRTVLMPILIAAAVSCLLLACGGGGGAGSPGGAGTPSSNAGSSLPDVPLPPIVAGPAAANTLSLRNAASGTLTGYPLQIGRAFVRGEVMQYPRLAIDDVPVASQADVSLRWDDGSVRFAVVSAVLPNVAAGQSIKLGFATQTSAGAGTATVSDLLAAFPDFDATLRLSAGSTTHTISARSMLAAGLGEWTARGPVRYSLTVTDHVGRSRDVGFDAYKPLRPVFYVDFWPTLNKVRVRAGVESPNLDALEDVQYDAQLSSGLSAPSVVWSKAGIKHYFGTRWSKTFWVGGAPESKVDLAHNVAYLASTGLIPNMDPALKPSTSTINGWLASWASVGKDIYEDGFWTHYMPTTGHRTEIGHMPAWMAAWLQTGDYRLRELSLTQADLANAWPTHFREHDASRKYDRAGLVSAKGRHFSLNAHPSLWFPNNNGVYPGTLPTPRMLDANNTAFGSWVFDGAHQPDAFGLPYLLTGDIYYLEGLQSWVATSAVGYAPGNYGRGKDGYGGMQDQVRGNAWVLRNRALAATLSPDGSPEKLYYYQLVDDAIAFWEGERGMTSSPLASHPNFIYAATNYPFNWSPLRFWGRTDQPNELSSPWQEWFFMAELGFVRDLGFPTERLLAEYSKLLSGQIGRSDYDWRYIASYRLPMTNASKAWYASWAEVGAVLQSSYPDYVKGAVDAFNGGPAIYGMAAAQAASYITPYPGGLAAWYWLKAQAVDKLDYSSEYNAWRVFPRASPLPVPPKPPGL